MKTYNYKGCKVTLRKEEYRNNEALAVALIKENGESYGTITVNLDNPLQSNELAFINEKHFPGIRKWIRKNKIGEFTGNEACHGSYSYPLCFIF